MKYYIPGCDVRRRHPEEVRKMEAWMNAHGIETAACCRKDLSFLRDGDMLIENCTLCELMLKERVPHITFISLYEYLDTADFAWPDFHGCRIVLQDCRRVQNRKALHEAVRSIMRKMNIRIIETEENREKSLYCGVWYNNPPAEDCVRLAPLTFEKLEAERELLSAEEQKAKMEAWVKRYGNEKAAVYCNGCEKGLLLGGIKPLHMIELITKDL
jgi:hypothetical protein